MGRAPSPARGRRRIGPFATAPTMHAVTRARAPAPHHNRLAALVRFPPPRLPALCSCVTNQRCASGCAIVSSAPKRTPKAARASRHRPLFSLLITMLRRILRQLRQNQRRRKPPNRKWKPGRRPTVSLIWKSLRRRMPLPANAPVETGEATTRAVGGGGEEAAEVAGEPRLQGPGPSP